MTWAFRSVGTRNAVPVSPIVVKYTAKPARFDADNRLGRRRFVPRDELERLCRVEES